MRVAQLLTLQVGTRTHPLPRRPGLNRVSCVVSRVVDAAIVSFFRHFFPSVRLVRTIPKGLRTYLQLS